MKLPKCCIKRKAKKEARKNRQDSSPNHLEQKVVSVTQKINAQDSPTLVEAEQTSAQTGIGTNLPNKAVALDEPKVPPPPVPNPPHIFKLAPELVAHIVKYLDYSSTSLLKLSCKQLYSTIPFPYYLPTIHDRLTILRTFPSTVTFPGDRSPPFLCRDCVMWHTAEYLVMWPYPRPERVFQSYTDFTIQKYRTCSRFAIRSGQWTPGKPLDKQHILCPDCRTPREVKSNQCSWNCQRCGTCIGRKGWAAVCQSCWKEGDNDTMRYGTHHAPVKPIYPSITDPGGTGGAESKSWWDASTKICGVCLGRLDRTPNTSREACRCRRTRRSLSDSLNLYEHGIKSGR